MTFSEGIEAEATNVERFVHFEACHVLVWRLIPFNYMRCFYRLLERVRNSYHLPTERCSDEGRYCRKRWEEFPSCALEFHLIGVPS